MTTYKVFWVHDAPIPNSPIREEHGSYSSFDDAYQSVTDWWHKNNFSPSIVRFIGEPEVDATVTIDYGPHTMFYEIVRNQVK